MTVWECRKRWFFPELRHVSRFRWRVVDTAVSHERMKPTTCYSLLGTVVALDEPVLESQITINVILCDASSSLRAQLPKYAFWEKNTG